eukprot:4759959-Heterocapsa_arctica.AAC.1
MHCSPVGLWSTIHKPSDGLQPRPASQLLQVSLPGSLGLQQESLSVPQGELKDGPGAVNTQLEYLPMPGGELAGDGGVPAYPGSTGQCSRHRACNCSPTLDVSDLL